MTGAILVLASVVLFGVYKISDLKPMFEWYAIGMGIIGWAFLIWGLIRDLQASRFYNQRHRNPRHKGDT